MSIIKEEELIKRLTKSNNVLLIEPDYERQYVPLGLAKIASLVKEYGGRVTYSKRFIPEDFDLICVTTLFTNDSDIVMKTIKGCQYNIWGGLKIPIIVGGVFASLMPEHIIKNSGYNVDVFVGFSEILDSYLPDYSVDWQVEGFFKDAMIVFTTRGCENSCSYCMVWRMEGNSVVPTPNWKENIETIDRKICLVSDNNFLKATPKFIKDVVDTLNRCDKRVIFNNGVDCMMVNKEIANLLSSLKYTREGFRMAFDKMSQDGHYQRAMENMKKAGFKAKGKSMSYVLFNFNDTPQDTLYRMSECWKYGSTPYLIRYRPLNQLKKRNTFMGKYWTNNLVKAFNQFAFKFGYKDSKFEDWIKTEETVKLGKEDWDKFYFKKGE